MGKRELSYTLPAEVVAGIVLATMLAGCAGRGPSGADYVPEPVLARYQFAGPADQWPLPRPLREASGLTHLAPGRLLAHDDNASTLWQLSYPGAPAPVAFPGQQDGPLELDFEGVTIMGRQVYLLASPGVLFAALLSDDRTTLTGPFERVPTGLEDQCNFEGIAWAEPADVLYLACKEPRHPRPGHIRLFQWRGAGEAPVLRLVDVRPVLDALGLPRLRPSGLAWVPEQGRLLVLAGKERVILELDPTGALLAWRRLAPARHRQPEGLARTPAGDLLIVDEADGRTATVSHYPPRQVQAAVQ